VSNGVFRRFRWLVGPRRSPPLGPAEGQAAHSDILPSGALAHRTRVTLRYVHNGALVEVVECWSTGRYLPRASLRSIPSSRQNGNASTGFRCPSTGGRWWPGPRLQATRPLWTRTTSDTTSWSGVWTSAFVRKRPPADSVSILAGSQTGNTGGRRPLTGSCRL